MLSRHWKDISSSVQYSEQVLIAKLLDERWKTTDWLRTAMSQAPGPRLDWEWGPLLPEELGNLA